MSILLRNALQRNDSNGEPDQAGALAINVILPLQMGELPSVHENRGG